MIPEPIANAQIRPAPTAWRGNRITHPEIGNPPGRMTARAVLSAADRKNVKHFAGPNETYPIDDIEHGRKAVQLSSHESPEARAKILAAVHRRFPQIKIDGGT